MSDEESFVILGTSPMPSLEVDGTAKSNNSSTSSLQSDTPGSRFTSLKTSQINDLQNAQEIATQTPEAGEQLIQPEMETDYESGKIPKKIPLDTRSMIKGIQSEVKEQIAESVIKPNYNIQPEMAEVTIRKDIKTQEVAVEQMSESLISKVEPKESINQSLEQKEGDVKLWSRKPLVQLEENVMPFSLEEYVIKSPLVEQQQSEKTEDNKQTMTNSTQTNNSLDEKINSSLKSHKTTPPRSVDSNLASSFILGDVDADVLKTSVYSQFPSISVVACAEDVVKLQNMVSEYNELKTTIRNANNTMKQFYQNSLNWKQKIKSMEEQYKQQLDNCRREIEMLRKQNQDLESNFQAQIEAIEIARKKDREETVQIISEKNALLENLRAQIVKLEQQQLASFEFVFQNQSEQEKEQFNKYYIPRREHEAKMKKIETQLSEMLAQNLDFKDVEKQYIDELNCLKVNLTAAEELIKENKAKISELQTRDAEKQQQIEILEYTVAELRQTNEKQSERITLLEHQTEVHRKDFEMEQQSRQTAVKEKQQILQDLRNLQRHNQELIEEHQKLAQNYERKLLASSGANTTQIAAASAAASSYFNNPQRPIRALPSSTSSAGSSTTPGLMHFCPICNKAFKSLNILQSHVNDCIDKH